MKISVVDLYEKTRTNPEKHMLKPKSHRFDVSNQGTGLTDVALAQLLSVYRNIEEAGQLENIGYDNLDTGWARVRDYYRTLKANEKNLYANHFYTDADDYLDTIEYGMMNCRDHGYIQLSMWNGIRYFKPTEQCMNLDLYQLRTAGRNAKLNS